MEQEDAKLTVELLNTKPVELNDFTDGLAGIGHQYKRFLAKNPNLVPVEDVRLYIKNIRPGSTIADLVPYAPYALPFIIDFNNLTQFTNYLRLAYNYFLGKSSEKPKLDRVDHHQLAKIVKPIVRDNGSQLNVYVNVNGDVKQHFHIDSIEANASQNSIKRALDDMTRVKERHNQKVVLYWYQARNDLAARVGDKAIIESVAPKPVKTIFDTERIKSEMLLASGENPFLWAYVVDVVVDTINERPALYKVVRCHEKFRKPGTEVEVDNDT